jgi:hypothetical protein
MRLKKRFLKPRVSLTSVPFFAANKAQKNWSIAVTLWNVLGNEPWLFLNRYRRLIEVCYLQFRERKNKRIPPFLELFYPDDGSKVLLRNSGNYLSNYKSLYVSGMLEFSLVLLWVPQNSQCSPFAFCSVYSVLAVTILKAKNTFLPSYFEPSNSSQ